MSNGYRLELAPWGDDAVHLTYWDSLHGEDVDFVLRDDGTALRRSSELTDEDGEKIPVPVNLVNALLELSGKLYGS